MLQEQGPARGGNTYQSREINLQIDHGIVLGDFVIDEPMPDIATFYHRRKSLYRIAGDAPSPTLSFSVMTMTRDYEAIARDILMYQSQRISLLGPGLICGHCGSKNPSGVLTCVFCGGVTQAQDWIVPVQLKGTTVTHSRDLSFMADEDTRRFMQWELMLDPDIDVDDLSRALVAQSTAIVLPVGNVLDEGYYLCHHCGGVTRVGDTCSGCGGEQIPLSEVVKMDRDCLYCGSKVTGGVICPTCGKRLAGETYRQWMNH